MSTAVLIGLLGILLAVGLLNALALPAMSDKYKGTSQGGGRARRRLGRLLVEYAKREWS